MKKKLHKLRYKIWAKFLAFFSHIKIHPYPFWLIIEPNTFKIKGHDYYEVRDLIKPGDIVLRGFDKYLDGYFIPGKFSHASFYVGGDKEQIIHAMTPNVQYTDLATFMRADRIIVLRVALTEDQIKEAIERAKSKLGAPYDYDFVFEKEDKPGRLFSCSELVYYIMKPFNEITGWHLKDVSKFGGLYKNEVFLPDDAIANNEIVWDGNNH